MPKRVLDVGQCNPDHSSLTSFLNLHFDVEVDRSDLLEDTLTKMQAHVYDMVMINRKLDADYSNGMEILKTIKSDEGLKATPVVIISNYAEAQELAVAAGAAPGFGKAELNSPETVEKVTAILS